MNIPFNACKVGREPLTMFGIASGWQQGFFLYFQFVAQVARAFVKVVSKWLVPRKKTCDICD
jgi:hypothetical protein